MPPTADPGGWRRFVAGGAVALCLGSGVVACANDDHVERAEVEPPRSVTADGPDGAGAAGGAGGERADASGPASPMASLVNDAAAATAEVTSGRFEFTMTASGVPELGGQDVVVARVDGGFDTVAGRSQVTVDLSGSAALMPEDASSGGQPLADLLAGFLEPMTIVTDGDTVYMSASSFEMLGVTTPWVSTPAAGGDGSVSTGFEAYAVQDVSDFLGLLDAVGDVTDLGPEEVDGVGTTRYRVDVDPAAVDELADDDFYGAFAPPGSLPGSIEVWIDGDGIIRRMVVDVDVSSVSGDAGTASAGTLRLELRVTAVGEPVEIAVPDPSQVTDLTTWAPDPGNLFGGEQPAPGQDPTTSTTGG